MSELFFTNCSTKRRKLCDSNEENETISARQSSILTYTYQTQDGRESKSNYYQRGPWIMNEKLRSYTSELSYQHRRYHYEQESYDHFNSFNLFHSDYSDSYDDDNNFNKLAENNFISSNESFKYSSLDLKHDLDQTVLNLTTETVLDIPKLINLDDQTRIFESSKVNMDRKLLSRRCKKFFFFHPYVWIKEEVHLLYILLQIYGKEWNIISKRIGNIKSPKLIEIDYYKNIESGYFYAVDFKEAKCKNCKKSGDPTMIFCFTCKNVYHEYCTDYKIENYKQYCSSLCYHNYKECSYEKNYIYPIYFSINDIPLKNDLKCNHNISYDSIIRRKRKALFDISSLVTWNYFLDLSKLCLECILMNDGGIIPYNLSKIHENHPLNTKDVSTSIFHNTMDFQIDVEEKDKLKCYFNSFFKNIEDSLDMYYINLYRDTKVDWEKFHNAHNFESRFSLVNIPINTKELKDNIKKDHQEALVDNDLSTSDQYVSCDDTSSDMYKSVDNEDSLSEEDLINKELIVNKDTEKSENDMYWIFQANPKYYDIRNSLQKVKDMTWFVNQHTSSIKENHKVFIWVSGKEAGILAVGTITIGPRHMKEEPSMKEFFISPIFNGIKLRCRIRIDIVLPSIIPKDFFSKHPLFRDLTILRAPIGTNFKVFESQGRYLDEVIKVFLKTNKLPDVNDYYNYSNSIANSDHLQKGDNKKCTRSRYKDDLRKSNKKVLNCGLPKGESGDIYKCNDMDQPSSSNYKSYERKFTCKLCKLIYHLLITDLKIDAPKESFICKNCYLSKSKFTKVKLIVGLRELRFEVFRMIDNRCKYIESQLNDLIDSNDENQWYDVVKKLGEMTDNLKRYKDNIIEVAEATFDNWMKKFII